MSSPDAVALVFNPDGSVRCYTQTPTEGKPDPALIRALAARLVVFAETIERGLIGEESEES